MTVGGFKLWAVGDTWVAADANTYLAHQVVPRFTTVANRNSAISSPQVGQMAWCDDSKELYIYSAATSTWVGAVPRTVFKTADTARASTTTLSNDPHLTISLEASSYYVMKCGWYIVGDSAGDFKFAGAASGGLTFTTASFNGLWMDITNTSSTSTNLHLDNFNLLTGTSVGTVTGNATWLTGTGRFQVNAAGTLTIQWAQNTSNATATTFYSGSFMSFLKVK